ncbi:MAG TPA: branched-chain amino acid ABC transporter permease [Methylomirabilota bacterium]|jgi:branched-chain amino acid transport system permease protein|nr:branched-chain amino acid ABC transporter permease [Methylomirabilota bacterium]HYR41115.1 branched-chain amino acid ABC transporter permease [Methylomirabilota bacterium]
MRSDFWILQTFNGLTYGALLFLLASGLSLIFGVMRVVNMAHGSYFLLGGYIGLTVALRTKSFAMALVAGTVAIALVGIAMERLFLRRLRGQELGQVLMTVGFSLIFQDLALLIWGGDPYNLPVPAALSGALRLGGITFPIYRIFIMGVAVVVGLGLWLLLDQTRMGAMIRAAVDDGEMAQGVGINVPRISLVVFGLGAALAALGGVVGAGFLGVYPGADSEVLPYAFVVVIVGGLGSLPGAMAGSLIVGLLDNFGKALFPELAYFTLFAPMAVILALRPTGLFGRA